MSIVNATWFVFYCFKFGFILTIKKAEKVISLNEILRNSKPKP